MAQLFRVGTTMSSFKRATVNVPVSSQKDGVTCLVLEFDADTDGFYLYGHADAASAPLFDLWQMTEDDAFAQAEADWGVSKSDWASDDDENTTPPTLDSNGAQLNDGDTITLIKDLPVKGAGVTIKRGTTVKNISLTNNPEEIDCRTKEVKGLVLKTCFVKKI